MPAVQRPGSPNCRRLDLDDVRASASAWVHEVPASYCVRSRMRIPSSAGMETLPPRNGLRASFVGRGPSLASGGSREPTHGRYPSLPPRRSRPPAAQAMSHLDGNTALIARSLARHRGVASPSSGSPPPPRPPPACIIGMRNEQAASYAAGAVGYLRRPTGRLPDGLRPDRSAASPPGERAGKLLADAAVRAGRANSYQQDAAPSRSGPVEHAYLLEVVARRPARIHSIASRPCARRSMADPAPPTSASRTTS